MGIFKLNGIDYMGGGGGGNTNYEELTQLEYDALTEEEKNNGTIYFITDANSNQDGKFQPVIYSESEREIGVWTDGKPLYQKTSLVNISNGTNTLDTITNGENIRIIEAFAIYNNIQLLNLSYFYSSNDRCVIYTNQNNVYCEATNTFAASYTKVLTTYQYTKTTDSPGSGQWTPQGVPAHHYNTEEQIVGTWINGDTIYEKTYTGLSVGTNGPTWVQIAAIDTSSMSDIIDCIAYMNTPTGLLHIALAEYVSTGSVLQVAVADAVFNRTINIITLRYTKTIS